MPSAKGNSTGTAFSIGKGVWMTARHVIEGCRKFGIKSGPKKISRGQNPVINPLHDLAIFDTRTTAPNFSFGNEKLFLGQDGFHLAILRENQQLYIPHCSAEQILILAGAPDIKNLS